jgi:hypothetical protein
VFLGDCIFRGTQNSILVGWTLGRDAVRKLLNQNYLAAGPVSRILSAGCPAGRSFLWAAHCCPALAAYPEV